MISCSERKIKAIRNSLYLQNSLKYQCARVVDNMHFGLSQTSHPIISYTIVIGKFSRNTSIDVIWEKCFDVYLRPEGATPKMRGRSNSLRGNASTTQNSMGKSGRARYNSKIVGNLFIRVYEKSNLSHLEYLGYFCFEGNTY